MGGSTADTPTTPEYLRASDAERDHAVSELRNEFAEGRLSHETFMYRMQSALDARNRGQLAGLFTDLPSRRPGPGKLLARIRAVLRGGDPAAREGPPDGHQGIPRVRQIAGHRYGYAPPRIPLATPGFQSQPASPAANSEGLGPAAAGGQASSVVPTGASRETASLVFPPGSGVRFTIGRTRHCDLCLTDLSVSRTHALLVRREDGWVLSDLGSHNGTRLNGWLVREPVQVRAGDRVEFGSIAFIIQGDPAPAPSGEEEPGLDGTGP
jgi:hypothetical protein